MSSRNSRRTQEIVALLREKKVTVRGKVPTGRWIEDLGELESPNDASLEEIVEHYLTLDALGYGQGKSAETTALRMLARGQRPEMARTALLRRFASTQALLNAGQFDQLDVERLSAHVEHEMLQPPKSSPLSGPMRQIGNALDDVPDGLRSDYAGALISETPQDRRASFATDILRMMSGGPVVNAELFIDVLRNPGLFGPDPKRRQRVALPDELDVAVNVARHMGAAFSMVPRILETCSLRVLAAAAVQYRHSMANMNFDGGGSENVEIVAACSAPFQVAMMLSGRRPHPDWEHLYSAEPESTTLND